MWIVIRDIIESVRKDAEMSIEGREIVVGRIKV